MSSKLVLPEQIKVARAAGALGASIEGHKFKLYLGANEVAILLSFFWYYYVTVAAGVNSAYLGLWRKSDSNPADMTSNHTDMIWQLAGQHKFVTESIKNSDHGHIVLPWPMVLIRAPRMAGYRVTAASMYAEIRLYYLIKKVSDAELAQLMVKDHA